ncbi:hypothetical protein MACK_000491 [Theileria orientalis]|uniref:Uncharacterized protein n=1 Tax=Theileria orientalis TaxID=68886 RepID=A0A976M9Q9_THEOR|nr:hypothetical protein MACK_000491 [Theileria orientalis]
MKFLGFNGFCIGVLVAVLRDNGVLGDCTIEKVGKHTSEEFKFDINREVSMFLQEIAYFLDQAEWITKDDVEHMLKILEHYRNKIGYEIYNKSVQLEVTKETLETNEYRKMVNEFRIFVAKEKEMDRQHEKNKQINKNKELDRMEEHEIESKDEELIEKKSKKEVDENGLRGNSLKEKDGDERKLENDIGSSGSSSSNGNSGNSSSSSTLTETDVNGAKPKQEKLEKSTSRRQYGGLSPIDEKLKGSGTEDEEIDEITRYEYELDTPELFEENFEELDVLPLREINRIRDKIDSIQLEIGTLEGRMKELIRIQGIVQNIKEQIDAYLRMQEENGWNEHFVELEIEQISINVD